MKLYDAGGDLQTSEEEEAFNSETESSSSCDDRQDVTNQDPSQHKAQMVKAHRQEKKECIKNFKIVRLVNTV